MTFQGIPFESKIKTLKQQSKRILSNKRARPVLFIAAFAIVGIIALLATRAAGPFASIEPEQGNMIGAACPVSDDSASNRSATQFGGCPAGGSLNLPRVSWEGGPAYWKKFPKADAAGWDDPNFFPISVFFGKPSHAPQYAALGVNTYHGAEKDGSTISSMTNTGMFIIAQREWTPADVGNDTRVVGWHLGDECDMGTGGCNYDANRDGREDEYDAEVIQRGFANEVRALNDGRFVQANYGNGILGTFWSPNVFDELMQMVDVATVDKYMYTSPHVWYITEQSSHWPAGAKVSSSAAYGWIADRMKSFLNPADLHPNWPFVETARPYLTEDGALTITPDQIEGAVWASIIHEARGISYFQHNNNASHLENNGCGTYSLVDCPDPARAEKIKAIHAKIRSLAPVINTQSYQYDFNNQTDTMLKTYNGSAYIFAGIGLLESPGNKTFNLPAGINGTTVEVVGENRTIPVTNRSFTDNFAAEYTHHVYRISL
jgi:hypothetical protein